MEKELLNRIKKALPEFTDRERTAMDYRWGLTNGLTHTLEETGKLLGVTRERIRQIEAKVLEKIRLTT